MTNAARDGKSVGTRPNSSTTDRTPGDTVKLGILWIPDGEQVQPLRVHLGLTDGGMTEVEGDHLTEGLEIIIGQQSRAAEGSDTTNPFAPKIPRRGGGSAGRKSGS